MKTTSPAMSTEQILSLAVEHAMRISDDESVVAALVFAPEVPRTRYELLGRVVETREDAPGPDTPLALWCHGGSLDPHWRQRICPRPNSLYTTLEQLRELKTLVHPLPESANALEELRALRSALDRVSAGPTLREAD
jgi:hypothetical protein